MEHGLILANEKERSVTSTAMMRRLRIASCIRCITQPTIKKTFVILVLLCLFSIWMLALRIAAPRNATEEHKPNPAEVKEPQINHRRVTETVINQPSNVQQETPQATTKQPNSKIVLLFLENSQSHLSFNITAVLEANHIKYRTVVSSLGDVPHLAYNKVGLYSAIVFENVFSYINLAPPQRDTIDQYCKLYNVGVVLFTPAMRDGYSSQIGDFPLYIDQHLSLMELSLNPSSSIYHILKPDQILKGPLPGDDWTVFRTNHSTYQPIAWAKTGSHQNVHFGKTIDPILHTTILHDMGTLDGVQRIFFGSDFKLWLHYLLFLDSIYYLSDKRIDQSLERYILIDVDDIFVGLPGIRLKPEDVEALAVEQDNLADLIPGFHFNLGFSGHFMNRGTEEENKGDEALVKAAHKFWWFPHMWDHSQPHLYKNDSKLEKLMMLNRNFAQEKNMPVDQGYAIAPHHSGVYPVHQSLYRLWREVWNVSVTSTEEYPQLRPARRRKGFTHDGIAVLPRQTCGLFTHTVFMAKYPGGRSRLDSSIMGGELFQTVINNPVNIFMTHLSNYGNDRLALYTFDKLANFLRLWTNLKLQTLPPRQLADKYFELFPEEKDPLWGSPCDDKRLTTIWDNPDEKCTKFPKFLVIGPQKTGTTALYTFLAMHPHIISNNPSPTSFEEVQFFNGNNYHRGLDWYLNFFPVPKANSSDIFFEKSAGYFDSSMAPARIHALLPKVKMIVILVDPGQRAYSWYKHVQAHNDPTSLKHSFYEVLTAGQGAPHLLRELKKRCLEPGKYAKHLEKWLKFFSPHQIHLVDGDMLREDPIPVMAKVIRFVHIKPYIDYSELLRYEEKKGFYCQVLPNGKSKCLGKSKGRQYEPMDSNSKEFLADYYRQHNADLASLLSRLGQAPPKWLHDSIIDRRDSRVNSSEWQPVG